MADPGVPTTWLDDELGGEGSDLATDAPLALVAATGVVGTSTKAMREDAQVPHGNMVGGTLHALAVPGVSHGFLDKDLATRIDSLPDAHFFDFTNYYIDDSAPPSNTGVTSGSPIPMSEWVRRAAQPWPYTYSPWIFIQSDFAMPRFDASWCGASNQCFPNFVATPKTKILTNATITAVQFPGPCIVPAVSIVFDATGKTATQGSGDFVAAGIKVGQSVRYEGSADNTGDYVVSAVTALVITMSTATIANETVTTNVVGIGGTEGKVTISSGSFASSVGKIAIVNAGPREGAIFPILVDHGSSVARIGRIQAAGMFDDESFVDLQAGDTFDTWDLYTCTTDFQQTGPFDLGGSGFSLINFSGDVNFGDATVAGFGGCTVAGESSIYSSAQVTISGCVTHDVELYTGGLAYLFGGASFGNIRPSVGSTVACRNFTMQGGTFAFNEISNSGAFISIGNTGWLACYDATDPIFTIPTGCCVVVVDHLWGQNCAGPRIVVNPGGSLVYTTDKPNFSGSNHDYSLVGSNLDANQIPASNVGSAAWIYEASTGGPNSGGSTSVVTNAANGLAPAQSVTAHTSGTPTLVVDPLGHENTVSGSVSGLVLPVGALGDKARVRLINFTSDIVITRSSSDTIRGATTYVIHGTANAYAWVDLECTASGVWTAIGGESSLPAYVAPANTVISLGHNGASTGSGHTDEWIAEDAASGAFNGGNLYFQTGALGNSASSSGNLTVHLNAAAASSASGAFILTAGASPTNRLKMYGYNDSGGAGGLHGEFRGGSFDWGSNSGFVDWTGTGELSLNFPTIQNSAITRYHFEGATFNGAELRGHVGLTTTGAVVVGNALWGMSTGEVIRVTAYTAFVDTGTGKGACVVRHGAFQCLAGTATQIGTTNNGGTIDFFDAALAGIDAGFTIASNNVKCTATGIAATNINVTTRMVIQRAA